MLRGKLLRLCFLSAVGLVLINPAVQAGSGLGDVENADREGTEVAAISSVGSKLGRRTALPDPLSDEDTALYRSAFDHSRQGQWTAADHDIAQLENPLLLGHLLASRYLASGYRASAEELVGWMARFADLPEANAIFALAKSRLGNRAEGLKPPARALHVTRSTGDLDEQALWDSGPDEPGHGLSAADRRHWQALWDKIHWLMHHDREDQAASLLVEAETARLMSPAEQDRLKADLAMAYFANGRVEQACKLAIEAADRSGSVLPQAHWLAGLALWRSGDRAQSARHFETLANAEGLSNWTSAAGAFWAARANLAAHRPQVVNHWLQQAAGYPRTFYGLLARRALGQDIEYSWESHPFTEADAEILHHIPAAQRAMALLHLGRRDLAQEELGQLLPDAGPALARSLLAVADDADLPGLAVQASGVVAARDGRYHDSGDYPLPEWRPSSGWSIDRALLLAIAKQESSFNPHARNPSGALGLMQLMPATARAVGAAGKLTDPQVNLELGQRYVRRLLAADGVKGNLLYLTAAYNVGPLTVARWVQMINPGDDALLFLESIPFHETRSLVEHVLTNFWAYRNRFDQSSPSLDAIAAGGWPMYDRAESKARNPLHVEN